MSEAGWEQHYVQDAFAKNWIAPLGENVDQFEKEFADRVDQKYAVAVSSGTAAIHLALKALKIGQGDIVLCSSLTFAASANPICYEGATPVFIDSEPDTWNMDPVALAKALCTEKNVKAVIVVHLYGIPAKMNEIMALCRQYQVPVIEDAAESLGSTYHGRQTGTIGDIGIYSFNGNKIITTSGGGMLVTDNSEYAERVKYLATQAREPVLHYEHREVGYNYRLSNICAGIGRGQLKVLNERITQKRRIFYKYQQLLSDLEEIHWMPEPKNSFNNFWLTCLTVVGLDTRQLIADLAAENIESRPIWKPMHQQPVFAQRQFYGNQYSDQLFTTGLCLPSDTKMTNADIKRVAASLRKAIQRAKHNDLINSERSDHAV
ncbi:DegT/DnrJ/EryC1/StrS family aminotransferase [Lapidilactobacillus bayanensis]|uniref:DegT/DnrJ/EryC1/StrS family aminotransferase n=1 Tax=Lapidilactobacillus bayanensis TaxID=2485998 RepID=UPI002989C8E1|nr:aminotransferase class I/II-fold pyridoxal phosphate-dependent enzyme [Lapidilactobacillus bayanensis]